MEALKESVGSKRRSSITYTAGHGAYTMIRKAGARVSLTYGLLKVFKVLRRKNAAGRVAGIPIALAWPLCYALPVPVADRMLGEEPHAYRTWN